MINYWKLLIMLTGLLCWNCQPGSSGYSCIDGNCVPISDNAQYHTLDWCLQNCDSTGYKCEGGNCLEVELDSAEFTSLEDCQNVCP